MLVKTGIKLSGEEGESTEDTAVEFICRPYSFLGLLYYTKLECSIIQDFTESKGLRLLTIAKWNFRGYNVSFESL